MVGVAWATPHLRQQPREAADNPGLLQRKHAQDRAHRRDGLGNRGLVAARKELEQRAQASLSRGGHGRGAARDRARGGAHEQHVGRSKVKLKFRKDGVDCSITRQG